MKITILLFMVLFSPMAQGAQICIDVPDAAVPVVRTKVTDRLGYKTQICTTVVQIDAANVETCVPNPETRVQFLKRKAAEWLKAEYRAVIQDEKNVQAQVSAETEANLVTIS